MNCASIRSYLSDYLDGELAPDRSLVVDQHLASCMACTRLLEELRATVRLAGHLGRHTCPVDLRSSVLSAVAKRPARRPVHSFFRATLAVSVGGSMMLACLSLPLVLHRATLRTGADAAPALAAAPTEPVHVQYDMANALGTTDGLLLSLPTTEARREATSPAATRP